jgi:hypothetical protein
MQTNEKYIKLKELLDDNKKWPLKYMFKFIIPNKDGHVDKAKAMMPERSKMDFKHTKSLKYVSLTCVAYMKSAEDIISLNQKMEQIPGAMTL